MMPYTLKEYDNGVILTFTGRTHIGEINKSNDAIYKLKNFNQHHYQIFDLVMTDFSQITEDQIVQAAISDKMASIMKEDYQVALIAKDSHTLKICKKYIETSEKVYGNTWSFKVFDSLAEALNWVNKTEI